MIFRHGIKIQSGSVTWKSSADTCFNRSLMKPTRDRSSHRKRLFAPPSRTLSLRTSLWIRALHANPMDAHLSNVHVPTHLPEGNLKLKKNFTLCVLLFNNVPRNQWHQLVNLVGPWLLKQKGRHEMPPAVKRARGGFAFIEWRSLLKMMFCCCVCFLAGRCVQKRGKGGPREILMESDLRFPC